MIHMFPKSYYLYNVRININISVTTLEVRKKVLKLLLSYHFYINPNVITLKHRLTIILGNLTDKYCNTFNLFYIEVY